MTQYGGHSFTPIHDGELEYCEKCMGFEGTLPTDCPGIKMTREQFDAVYKSNYDFRKDEGWVNRLSPMGNSYVRGLIFDMLNQREGAPKSEAEIILKAGITKSEYNKVRAEVNKYLYTRSVHQ